MIRVYKQFILLLCISCVLTASAIAASPPQPPLADLQGKPLALEQYRGRIVLVNYWATWCAPCRKEMPELNVLSKQLDSKRALVLGIAADEPAEVKTFLDKFPVQYQIVTGDPDPVFAWTAALGNTSLGLPFSILLDANGAVRWRKAGGTVSAKEVSALIERLLAGKSI
jgi:thiol-disulfide isomerase/thioredoxin